MSIYESALRKIRSVGIMVDGSFVWGYDGDTRESFKEDLAFSINQRLLFAEFNHLMPYPGTDVYQRLQSEGRLLYGKWWLEQEDFFGSVAFKPRNITPDELALDKFNARRIFYNFPNTVYRLSSKTNLVSFFFLLFTYFAKARLRRVSRREESQALPSKLISQKKTS